MEQAKPKVQVLMSAYNGEKYLREQLDSILNQNYKNIEILIRDDGSTDSTPEILKEYAGKYQTVTYVQGKNCGPAKSFFKLIKMADKQANYYALSDQDDIWEPDKVARALTWLDRYKRQPGNKEIPLMYCSALTVVDENLRFLYQEGTEKRMKNFSFGNAMVENCCTGCTMVFNRALQKMIAEKRIPHCSMHDWWIYLVASCFGKVLYDPSSKIQYRQHADNVIGMEEDKIKKLKKKIRGFQKGRNVISCQLMEFYRIYHPCGKHEEMIKQFLYAKYRPFYRVKLAIGNKLYRQNKFDNIVCKILILTGSM